MKSKYRITVLRPRHSLSALVVTILCAGAALALQGVPPVYVPSSTHPASVTAQRLEGWPLRGIPLSEVSASAEWTYYSESANFIRCAARSETETWLGTRAGIKLVDRRRGTVRHFGIADGLTSAQIEVLAVDGGDVWCITPADTTIAHCLSYFDRKAGRWREAGRLRGGGFSTDSVPESPDSLPSRYHLSASNERVAVVRSPVERNLPLARVYHQKEARWEDIPWEPGLRADKEQLRISFVKMDRDSLWVGTLNGLLRYRFGEKQWERTLPEMYVHAGERSANGIWVIGYRNNEQPLTRGEWVLVHLPPNGRKPVERIVASLPGTLASQDRSRGGIPTGLAVREKDVWITLGYSAPTSAPFGFLSLDLTNEKWETRRPSSPAELDSIPEELLFHPTLRRDTLVATWTPQRVPSWFCPDTALPEGLSRSTASGRFKAVYEDAREVWFIAADRKALTRTDVATGKEERFAVSGVTVEASPPIYAIASDARHLYVRTSTGVSIRPLAGGAWREVDLSKQGAPAYFGGRALLAAEGRVWAQVDTAVVRIDPGTAKAETFKTGFGSQTPVAAAKDHLWLWGGRGLTRLDLATGAMGPPVEITLPENLKPANGNLIRVVAVSEPYAWLSSVFRFPDGKDHFGLAGFNLTTQEWTVPLECKVEFPINILERSGRYLMSPGESIGAVWSYDPAARRWAVLAVPAPRRQQERWRTLSLIDVTDTSCWCVEPETGTLWEYDRADGDWSDHACPAKPLPGTALGLATRAGGDFYVATAQGIWRFGGQERNWNHLPVPVLPDVTLRDFAMASSAAWVLAEDRRKGGQTAFVARLDRAARTWRLFTDADGFSSTADCRRLVRNEAGIWAIGFKDAYHLTPGGARWTKVADLLNLGPGAVVRVEEVAASGGVAWIAAQASRTSADGGYERLDVGPLIRYDPANQSAKSFNPRPGQPGNLRALLVEPQAIWLALDGLYRFDRGTETFSAVQIPRLFATNVRWGPDRLQRSGKDLWLFSGQTVIQWKSAPPP